MIELTLKNGSVYCCPREVLAARYASYITSEYQVWMDSYREAMNDNGNCIRDVLNQNILEFSELSFFGVKKSPSSLSDSYSFANLPVEVTL